MSPGLRATPFRPGPSVLALGADQILRCRISAQSRRDPAPPGQAIEQLAAPFTGVAAGDGLQIRKGLLAETALVGLGAVLQGWHGVSPARIDCRFRACVVHA